MHEWKNFSAQSGEFCNESSQVEIQFRGFFFSLLMNVYHIYNIHIILCRYHSSGFLNSRKCGKLVGSTKTNFEPLVYPRTL